ncbi:MAG: hypothetical protein V4820_14655 [Pseudomonadota bacterium]|uniref:hypothetical protein n=1 Tax=Phenylobacterium sp. TaxID=1871053 RepID=UPI0027223352|nr:hypothetical protein [Phenylobacterium sp.]MDO9430615.1 hypothetical protein [Phenylobacterium sp.]
MKKLITSAALGLSLAAGALVAAPAFAQAPAATAAPSAGDTPIADIAATPEGKAALDKNLPGLTAHEAYEQFKGMTLKQVQPMSQGAITDDQIKALQADLDKGKK